MFFFLFLSPFILNAQDKCLSGDCQNGMGKMECECGYTYEGEFKNGMKVHGVMTKKEYIYEGDFKDDMAHGQGKITFKDRSWYKGTFAFSEPDGKGTYQTSSGYTYTGDLVAGYFKGWGDKVKVEKDSTSVDRYTGSFDNDQLNGVGMHQYSSGVREIGQFQKNKLHGIGLIVYLDGAIEIGKFKKGRLEEEYVLKDQGVVQLVKELDVTELKVIKNEGSGSIEEIRLDSGEIEWKITFTKKAIDFYFNGQSQSFEL